MKEKFVIDLKDYDEGWEHSLRPSVRAIIQQDDKLAMVYNQKYDYYAFPGGGVEDGENFHQALIREVKEETGLKVIPETIEEQVLEDYEEEEGLVLTFVEPKEALRKNLYDDHKENNGSAWIKLESGILEMLIEGRYINY